MKNIRINLFILLVLGLSSCVGIYLCTEGSGRLSKQTFELPNFKNIISNVSAKLFIIQDSISKLQIETDDNLLDAIFVDVNNEVLTVTSEKGLCPRKLEITLTSPLLNSIEINGSSDIIAQTPIVTNEFAIKLNGSGDIQIDSIKAQVLTIKVNGSGDIRLGGIADELIVTINGSSDLNASKLVANSVEIKTNGSGDVYVHSKEKLYVNIYGSGNVYYIGNPNFSDIRILGSGVAQRMNNNKTK